MEGITDATTHLLDKYRQEGHSQLCHSIIKSIEESLLQIHNSLISGMSVSQGHLTPIRFELYKILQSCFVHDYYIGQTAMIFGGFGVMAGVTAYFSSDNRRYMAQWGTGIGVFGMLFFGALYLNLNF